MRKEIVLLGLVGIGFLVWGIGILIQLWSSPIFSFFMVASNTVADILSYFGLAIGALLLASALIIFYQGAKSRSDRIYGFYRLERLKHDGEFYEDYWSKRLMQQPGSENVDSDEFVIVNGRRVDLGSEVMEKIVD
jgi:hypothetical protein